MNLENQIFETIGQIIQTIQYIEWNLCNELNIDPYEDMTLGQIIGQIEKAKIIDDTKLQELKKICEKRNNLIHMFFKENDFEKHSDNREFLKNKLGYTKNFAEQLNNFNNWLVKMDKN